MKCVFKVRKANILFTFLTQKTANVVWHQYYVYSFDLLDYCQSIVKYIEIPKRFIVLYHKWKCFISKDIILLFKSYVRLTKYSAMREDILWRSFLPAWVAGVDRANNPLKLKKHLKFSDSYNKHRASRGVFATRFESRGFFTKARSSPFLSSLCINRELLCFKQSLWYRILLNSHHLYLPTTIYRDNYGHNTRISTKLFMSQY